ncbi:MAG: response regulator [Bradymonadia bacterium]
MRLAVPDDEPLFAEEDGPESYVTPNPLPVGWTVLVVDDDPSVHLVSRLVFSDLVVDGQGIELVSAHSAREARELLGNGLEVAVAVLDVVMETESAGLDLAAWIRQDTWFALMRIVLRTGQPGREPNAEVLGRLHASDYWSKEDLTANRARSRLTSQIQEYQALLTADRRTRALQSGLEATTAILRASGPEDAIQVFRAFVSTLFGIEAADAVLEVLPPGHTGAPEDSIGAVHVRGPGPSLTLRLAPALLSSVSRELDSALDAALVALSARLAREVSPC